MLRFKNLVLKLFGRLILYIFYVVLVVFYLVLFQIPIPFIGDNVAHLLQKKYAKQAEFIDNLQIRGVSIAWNYEINRPIILIKNVTYTSGNKVTKLDKIGFYPNITNSIKQKNFLIEKVYVEGLHIVINQDMQKNINIKLNNISNLNTDEKKEGTKQPLALGKRFNITNAYADIKNIKRMAPVLAYLNEFSISHSDIVFVNNNKNTLNFNIESLDIKDLKNIHVDIKSTLKINSGFSKSAQITGNLVLNSKEEVVNRLTIKDLSLEDIATFSTGLVNKKLLQPLSLKGFLANIEMQSIYNLRSGFKDIKGNLHIGSGSIGYEGRLARNLEIDKLQMNLKYNKTTEDLDFTNLVVNFKKNNRLKLNRIGANILLSQLSMNAKLNLQTKQILVYKSFLLGNSQKVNFSAKYNYADTNKRLVNFSSDIGNMSLQDLKSLWPTKVSLDVREWFDDNVLKANISSIKFNLLASFTNNSTNIEKVSSEILFNNVELTYLEGLPSVKSNEVKLVSSGEDIIITFGEATTAEMRTTKGLVKIYDYSFANGYQPGVYVDLDVDKSNVSDVLNYIDRKPLELLHGIDLNIADLQGTAQGNITLLYAIDDDKLVDFSGKVTTEDLSFKNVFQKQSLNNGNLDVSIGKDYIIFNGKAVYLETPANLDIRYSWGSGKTVSKYALNFDKLAINKLYQLNLVDEKILNQFKGFTNLTINYKEYEKVASANIQADLKQAEWKLKEFNYTKPVGTPLFLNTQISLDNNKLLGIDRLNLSNNDINIVLGVTKGNNSLAMKVSRLFIRNKADARVNFLWQKDSTNIFVRGKFLDITSFIDDFKAGDNTKKTSAKNKKQASKLSPIAFNRQGIPIYNKEKDSLLKQNTSLYQVNSGFINNSYNVELIDSEVPINNQDTSISATPSITQDENAKAVNDNTKDENNTNTNKTIEMETPENTTSTLETPNTTPLPNSKDQTNANLHVAKNKDKESEKAESSDAKTSSLEKNNTNTLKDANNPPNSKVELNDVGNQDSTKTKTLNSSNNNNSSIDKIAVSSKPLHNYKIDLALQSIRSHKITFANPSINLIILNNILDYMDFSYFERSHKSYIFYNSKEKGLLMEVSNVGNLLQFLDVKARIKNGFLQVKAKVEKILDSTTKREVFISKGSAVLNDFSLYLALGFSSVVIDFNSKGYYFNLTNIELTGNLMGGHLAGYLDYNKKYLDVRGKLVPIWSATHLISNAPIIRQLLGNDKEGNNNNLLQINMAITGPLDKLNYSIFSKGGKKGEVVNSLNNDEIRKTLDDNNTTKATAPNNLSSKKESGEATSNPIQDSPNSKVIGEENNTTNSTQLQSSSSQELVDTPKEETPKNLQDSNTKAGSTNITEKSSTEKAPQDSQPSPTTEKSATESSKVENPNKDSTTKSTKDAPDNKKKAEEGLSLQDLLK
ncbi:invasion associated endopeptidase [Candidatus Hepatincola sp. Pdp]